MEMLNSASMLLSSNLWTNIINFFASWIVNYGWAIIVFTICLKLILSPLDIFQRIASGKQQRVMSAMQPEINAVNQKYANDKEKLNQETNKIYKKYKVNMGGMCLTMLITMIITLVIFFTLYASIRNYGVEKLYSSYHELDTVYQTAESEVDTTLSDEEQNEYILNVVVEKYDELKDKNSWLWVKNVWKSDTSTSQFVDFEDYASYIGLNEQGKEEEKAAALERYNAITSVIVGDSKDQNGYYILIILAVVLSFLTQFISAKILQPKGQKLNTANKIMMAIIPISMLIFAMTSNVVFTLYIITNSVMSAIISTILSLIMRKRNSKLSDSDILKKSRDIQVVEYSRNYKK